MCQPKSQGGRRCAAHTRPHYLRVISSIYEGNESDAASKASSGFEAIRDFAMTQTGRPHIENDINALEEHYFAYPSTSIQQETDRQTTLATLRAAVTIGEQRHEALAEVKAIVKETGLHVPNQSAAADQVGQVIAEREQEEEAARAAAFAQTYGWALRADTIPLEVTLPERTINPAVYEAVAYRLANAVPGDTFDVRAGGDTLTVAYDERFETDTGRTTYILKLDTLTSHSEHQFISRDHITANVRDALFTKGAWVDRRTATNPNLTAIVERDYDQGIIRAAAPYTTNFKDFHAQYATHYKALSNARPNSSEYKDAWRNLEALDNANKGALSPARRRTGDYKSRFPHPDEVRLTRSQVQEKFNKAGVETYLKKSTEDEANLEAARNEHRAAMDEWNTEQQKRQQSAMRRLLPSSPPPVMRQVERQTAPHPFGGMTKGEWVAYETDNLRNYGTTDLSEFTTHRGRAQAATHGNPVLNRTPVTPTPQPILTPQPQMEPVYR